VIAFVGMTLAKSQHGRIAARIVRWILAISLLLAALWIVVKAIPYPRDPGMPTFSIVGSAVLIAGLAAEELIGADVRRLLGI